MGSAVGFQTISLVIKHAWGESFITGRNKAALPAPRVSTSHGKSLFPWQPNWLSLSQEWGRRRRRRQARRGSCVEAWHSTVTSTWPLGEHAILVPCSPGEEHRMVTLSETKICINVSLVLFYSAVPDIFFLSKITFIQRGDQMFYRRQRKDVVMDCHYSMLTDTATEMLEQKPTSFFPPVVGL